MSIGITLAERGLLPDAVTRIGIRRLLRERLRDEDAADVEAAGRRLDAFAEALRAGPIAIDQDAANRQHYEVPARFFELVLGPQLKYSCCHFADGDGDLAAAEESMLALTAERARLTDGQEILEIGCGWGSLTLWMARSFPRSRIRAVSNSASQREFILERARSLGLTNLTIDTADIATYQPSGRYDRIVSVECLEHCRNYAELFSRMRCWLRPEGRAFIHVFCHRAVAYPFETEGDDNWMGRHFFTGGIMPGYELFDRFDDDLQVERRWPVSGLHYARTARAWLERTDRHRDEIVTLFARDLGREEARRMFHRWRMFFLACEELFGYRSGEEWLVGHYLLRERSDQRRPTDRSSSDHRVEEV